MKRELLERVLHSVIPRSQILEHARNGPKSASRSEKRMHSGTTVLAFRYADGVLFAADRKTSDSYLGIIDVDSYKIHQLSNLSIIGCAGSVGDIQFVVKAMEQVAEGFWGQFGYPLSILGQANHLANILRDFSFYVWPLEVHALIGGLSLKGEFEIYEVWGDGGKRKGDYITIGSGTDYAQTVLKANKGPIRDKKLNLKNSIDLALKAIYRAGESDNGTSDLRIATPTIAVVTKNGFEEIDTRIIEKAARVLIERERQ